MAARLRKNHQEDVRLKIQASQIINRLQSHFNGDIELTASQIQTAKILLDKSISNAPTITETDLTVSGAFDVRNIVVNGVKANV